MKKIKKLKDSQIGKSCIIVGNGPSLRIEDLSAIKESGIDSFGSNRIVDLLENTPWRPDYLCVMDPSFLIGKNRLSEPLEYFETARAYGIKNYLFVDILKNFIPKEKHKHICFSKVLYTPLFSKVLFPWTKNMEYWVSDLGSVSHFAIQFACYMGYRTIYLYGMDNTYTKYLDNNGKFRVDNTIESHANGMKKDVVDKHIEKAPKNKFEAYNIGGFADKRKNDMGYTKCKIYAEKHGINIMNLTRGGHLEIFPRASFDETIGRY